jgi:hypothetical protein
MIIRKAKMKKLTVILGGSVDFYQKHMNLLRLVEKKTRWKIKKINFERFSCKVNGIDIDILFCWNPIRDAAYYDLKKFAESKLKFAVHLPASELVKKIKNIHAVLFIGNCGAFQGKKEETYLPSMFNELLFKKLVVDEEIIKNLKPKGKINIKNILQGKIKGKESIAITSNLTLSPNNMLNHDKDLLIKAAKKLSKYGDMVEKESYQIVKAFKNKIPLGVIMISSDVLSIKKHMMDNKNFKPNKENFANTFIKSIKIMVNELK